MLEWTKSNLQYRRKQLALLNFYQTKCIWGWYVFAYIITKSYNPNIVLFDRKQ